MRENERKRQSPRFGKGTATGTSQTPTCDKVHSTWRRDLFLSQTEQRFKSCGVEGDQRAEPCNAHLALQFPTDSILDVLGMVCIFVKLKGKYQERLLCDHTAFKVEPDHKTQASFTVLEDGIANGPHFDHEHDTPVLWQQGSDGVKCRRLQKQLQTELVNRDESQACALQSSAWSPCGQHQIPSMANWKAREVDGRDVLCVCLFTLVTVCAVLSKCALFSCFTTVVGILNLYDSW